jgi:hypothetical protein
MREHDADWPKQRAAREQQAKCKHERKNTSNDVKTANSRAEAGTSADESNFDASTSWAAQCSPAIQLHESLVYRTPWSKSDFP